MVFLFVYEIKAYFQSNYGNSEKNGARFIFVYSCNRLPFLFMIKYITAEQAAPTRYVIVIDAIASISFGTPFAQI